MSQDTLEFFQVDKKKKSGYRDSMQYKVDKVEKEVKKHGSAYCHSRATQERLQTRGYLVGADGLVEKGE